MKTSIALTFALLASANAFAGSSYSEIKCTSASGRSSISSYSDDFSPALTEATFTVDGKKTEFSQGRIVYAYTDGVISVSAHNDQNYTNVTLWSVPASVRVLRNLGHQVQVEFNAKVIGTDPRTFDGMSYGDDTKVIGMKCTLKYEI
jgi:hypothetical protein